MIIYLLTFYLLDDIEKNRNHFVEGNFDKNASVTFTSLFFAFFARHYPW